MSLNKELFWKAYRQSNETDTFECMSPDEARPYLKWIRSRIDFPELLELLADYPFFEDVGLCALYFFGPKLIKKWTKMHNNLAEKFLVIGMTCNGDYIAVPLDRPGEVGFVDHETLNEERGICNYIAVCEDIGELYFNSWNKPGFPCDYYDALKMQRSAEGSPLGKPRRRSRKKD